MVCSEFRQMPNTNQPPQTPTTDATQNPGNRSKKFTGSCLSRFLCKFGFQQIQIQLKIPNTPEEIRTKYTHKHSAFSDFVAVSRLVPLQIPTLAVYFVAFVTFVWLFSTVHILMGLQLICSTERLATYSTFMQLHSTME